MSSRARQRRAAGELAALYAQVPDVGCRGLCQDQCSTLRVGPAERAAVKAAGGRVAQPRDRAEAGESLADPCPSLTSAGRCGVYAVRPMICRVYGAAEGLPCPHGCRPAEGLLQDDRVRVLLDRAMRVKSGEGTDRGR